MPVSFRATAPQIPLTFPRTPAPLAPLNCTATGRRRCGCRRGLPIWFSVVRVYGFDTKPGKKWEPVDVDSVDTVHLHHSRACPLASVSASANSFRRLGSSRASQRAFRRASLGSRSGRAGEGPALSPAPPIAPLRRETAPDSAPLEKVDFPKSLADKGVALGVSSPLSSTPRLVVRVPSHVGCFRLLSTALPRQHG